MSRAAGSIAAAPKQSNPPLSGAALWNWGTRLSLTVSTRPTGFVADEECRSCDGEAVGLRLALGSFEEGERQRPRFR
jgi:hypothetical protein